MLGVWPVVLNCLMMYKATKDGRGYGVLLNELKTEEIVYREFVRHLLQADVPEADLVQLTDRKRSNVDLWNDQALHSSLERRLGEEKSKIVLETLVEMDKLLASLGEKLGGTDDVRFLSNLAVYKSYHSDTYHLFPVRELRVTWQKGKIRNSIRQMKHTLPTSSFRQELESLKKLNGLLQKLITNCTASGFPAQGGQSASPPRLSSDILKENTIHAEELHHAICNSYNCQCQSPHEASLALRQASPKILDTSEPFELIFPVDEEKKYITERDVKSQVSPSYSSMASTAMTATDESYDSFGMGYDILPIVEETSLMDNQEKLPDVGRQGIALEVYRPLQISKTAPLPLAIKEAGQFRLAGVTMALKMVNASMTYVFSSKNWMILPPYNLRLLV